MVVETWPADSNLFHPQHGVAWSRSRLLCDDPNQKVEVSQPDGEAGGGGGAVARCGMLWRKQQGATKRPPKMLVIPTLFFALSPEL